MNVALLKLADRYRDGEWRWSVPGYGNGVTYLPEALSIRGWGASVRWPIRDDKGEATRAVDLDRHRTLAKAEIRKLLRSLER